MSAVMWLNTPGREPLLRARCICGREVVEIVPNHSAFRKRNKFDSGEPYHSLKSPLCWCVSITLPKRESQRHLPAEKLCVADCIADCVWLDVPQAAEWERIRD